MYFTPHLNEIDYTSSYKDSLFEKQKKNNGNNTPNILFSY